MPVHPASTIPAHARRHFTVGFATETLGIRDSPHGRSVEVNFSAGDQEWHYVHYEGLTPLGNGFFYATKYWLGTLPDSCIETPFRLLATKPA